MFKPAAATILASRLALLLPIVLGTLPGISRADPESESLCDIPSARGTAMYNKYCTGGGGNDNGGSNAADDAAAQQAAAAAAAAAAAQRERDAELQQQRAAAESRRRAEAAAAQAQFLDDRDSAVGALRSGGGTPVPGGAGGLRGSGAAAGDAGAALRGSGAGPVLRDASSTAPSPAKPVPVTDSAVVDARQVPSGLPTDVDTAIAAGYASAPAGVGDRVRKGFQAIATHDWPVARAWFADALQHDPGNAGLQRLVDLADYTEKHRTTGTPETETLTHSADNPAPHDTPALRGALQTPQDADMALLFPNAPPAPAAAATAAPASAAGLVTAPAQQSAALPDKDDFELLFPGLPALEAKEMNDYMWQQALTATENDPVLKRISRQVGPAFPAAPAGTDNIHN